MAFGDQLNIVQADGEGATLTVTYSGGTPPSADDLNVCYAFTGATTIVSMTTGFTEDAELLNTVDSDEGGIWSQLVADSGDNTITMTPSASDESGLILVLFEGAFQSFPVDLVDGHNGPGDTNDPLVTGVSGASIALADSLMCGICCQRSLTDQTADDFNRQGNATPTSPMTKVATQDMSAKRIYAGVQLLTAIGTIGISRGNNQNFRNMIGYVIYKTSGDQTVRVDERTITAKVVDDRTI